MTFRIEPSRWREWLALRLIALLSFVSAIAFGQEENEPIYHGRKLSDWLLGYTDGSLSSHEEYMKAEEAIHKLGADVIPTVLRMMEAPDQKLNIAGMYAFYLAKTNLASAVPELTRIYERAVSAESMRFVAGAFGNLGASAKDAAPALVRGLNHPDPGVRRETVTALMHIRGDVNVVVPALIKVLRDPRSDIKDYALSALTQYGEEAKSALPDVLAIYRGDSAQVAMDSDPKRAADRAIWSIAPHQAEGLLVVEDEAAVRLNFDTTMELYAEFADKGACILSLGNERGILIWARREQPFAERTGGRFELYRPKHPPERGMFLRSELEVEKFTLDRASRLVPVSDIRFAVSGGKLLLTARDPKGKPLKLSRVRREDWDDWATQSAGEAQRTR